MECFRILYYFYISSSSSLLLKEKHHRKNLSFSIMKLFIHFLIFQHVSRSIEAKIKPKTWYQDTCRTMQTDQIYIYLYGKWKKDWFLFNFLLQSNGKRLTIFAFPTNGCHSVFSIETLYSRLAIINVNRRHSKYGCQIAVAMATGWNILRTSFDAMKKRKKWNRNSEFWTKYLVVLIKYWIFDALYLYMLGLRMEEKKKSRQNAILWLFPIFFV